MTIFEKIDNRITPHSNLLLLILVFFFVFIIPFFPENSHKFLGQLFFSLIFFISIFALNTGRMRMLAIALVAFITEWISDLISMPVINYISVLTNILFFQIIVIKLIIQIAKSNRTDAVIIMESINGYLLMGLMFTSWVSIAIMYDPTAFSFTGTPGNVLNHTYYTFVTMTTLGYGDIIPQLPYAKSLAVLISTSGQIYVAVIIAMLVGKYAGSRNAQKS